MRFLLVSPCSPEVVQQMGEGKDQRTQSPSLPPHQDRHAKDEDNWLIMEGGDDGTYNTSSLDNSSTNTNGSTSSSSDMVDDASSSPISSLSSSSSTLNPSGPLFELSELIANLPIKRGLSKYYEGKSQSFTSLFSVSCTEDLAKKGVPYRRKSKACKSYGNGLDAHKPYPLPKAVISKKAMHSLYLRPLSPAPIHKKF